MLDRDVVLRLLSDFDSAAHREALERAEAQRAELLRRFPKDAWPTMTLDNYALGQAEHPDNFCRWMEFVAVDLGSIRGGSALKHLIYFQAGVGEWWFDTKLYSSVDEAWTAVRQGFVDAIAAGEGGNWDAIEKIGALRSGRALVCKTMHLYFPTEILPVNSGDHLRRFLRGLGDTRANDQALGTISLNRMLLDGLRAIPDLDRLSTIELQNLLYYSDLSPFLPPVFETPIPDVAAFIRDTLTAAGDDRLEARRAAEDQARRLLDDRAGGMSEDQLRELLRLFNADSKEGKPAAGRFSPGFGGHIANGLATHLDAVNIWTERIWGGVDFEPAAAVDQLLVDRKAVPSAGVSYPTMLAYLRDPSNAAVWGRATDAGLRRLTTYRPRRASPGDPSDYKDFCAASSGLMRDYEIPPELLDYVLAAAASYKPDAVEVEEASRVWVFQANPTKYDIDGALSELAEVDWVVRQYKSDIHASDRVYIWRSGAEGGIIATAQVDAEPAVANKTDDPFVLDPEAFAEPELSVKLRISEVLPKALLRSDLVEHPVLKDLGVISFANATNFAVTAEQDAALLALIRGEGAPSVKLPEITETAAERVFLPKEWLDRVVHLLRAKRQVIFYGPPGTGKTFVAQEIAKDITREGGDFVLVQFHPSYSYEDFFEGYRPYELDGGAGLGYRLTHGPLRRLANAAAANPSRPYVLIVDEINRGNVPKIFGELLFLLEYRERMIALQYSPDEPFSLPRNLFVIGTMNTADRSIALVDVALRRRFYFVPFLPSEPPVRDVLPAWLSHHGYEDDEPARLLEALNSAIGDQEIAIGPSYFMGPEGSVPDLDHVWEHAIMPLLEEHYYGTGVEVASEFGVDALRKKLSGDRTSPPVDEVDEAHEDERSPAET